MKDTEFTDRLSIIPETHTFLGSGEPFTQEERTESRGGLHVKTLNDTSSEYSDGMITEDVNEAFTESRDSELENDGRAFILSMNEGGESDSEGWVNNEPGNVSWIDVEPKDDRKVDGFALNIDGWAAKVMVIGHFNVSEEQTNISTSTLCVWLYPTRWFFYNFLIVNNIFQVCREYNTRSVYWTCVWYSRCPGE